MEEWKDGRMEERRSGRASEWQIRKKRKKGKSK